MSPKINKAQTVHDYVVNNLEMLINSKKPYNELFNDFNKVSKIKVSESLFYNVFNKVLNDKNLTRERPKKNRKRNQKNNNNKQQLNNDSEQSNEYNTESEQIEEQQAQTDAEQSEDNNKPRPVSTEEAAALLDSSSESFKDNEEQSEESEENETENEDENKPLYSNVHITPDGNYEKFLRERGHKTLGIFDEILPRTIIIIDVSKRFKIHEKLYAPVVLFISKGIPLTNEVYNLKANEEYNKNIKSDLINVVRIPYIDYSHKFYNFYPPHCFVNDFLPFIDSCYRKDKLILHNLHYKKSEDVIPISYL